MTALAFLKCNDGWNAEPNAPCPKVSVTGSVLRLDFLLNGFAYEAHDGERGQLTFSDCRAWRLGPVDLDGWYRGQCRYSGIARAWGEFYELTGEDNLASPTDWQYPGQPGTGARHFLFYFRDETFECLAGDWSFARQPALPTI